MEKWSEADDAGEEDSDTWADKKNGCAHANC